MNTNMTDLDGYQKSLRPSALNESSLSIGRVNAKLKNESITWNSIVSLDNVSYNFLNIQPHNGICQGFLIAWSRFLQYYKKGVLNFIEIY